MDRRLFRAASGAVFALTALAAPVQAQEADSASIFDAERAEGFYEHDGFGYTLPDEVAEFPGLNEQLTAEREQARAEFDDMVTELRSEMPDSPMLDHLAMDTYWVSPGRAGRLLSLASTTYIYGGGAHGNTGYGARIWDTAEDHAVDFAYLFTDRYAAYAIIDRAYCAQLAAMQADRGVETDYSWWNACPLLHEQAIAPGSGSGGAFDTIHIVVAPYVAGPYVAGSFEISVPVTQALVDLVKPEYHDAFAAAN